MPLTIKFLPSEAASEAQFSIKDWKYHLYYISPENDIKKQIKFEKSNTLKLGNARINVSSATCILIPSAYAFLIVFNYKIKCFPWVPCLI